MSAPEGPRDKEICHLIASRTSGHSDPSDFAFTKYLLISLLWKPKSSYCHQAASYLQSHPKSSDVFHFSTLIFDMSLSCLYPDRSWQFWQTKSLCLPIVFVIHPEVTANPEDASHAQNTNSSLTSQRHHQSREGNSGFSAPSRGCPTDYLGLFLPLFNTRNLGFPQNWEVFSSSEEEGFPSAWLN